MGTEFACSLLNRGRILTPRKLSHFTDERRMAATMLILGTLFLFFAGTNYANAEELDWPLRESDTVAKTSSGSVRWVPTSLTRIGNVDTDTTNVQTFSLPSSIPTSAKEVLIYAYFKAGYSKSAAANARFYTQVIGSGTKYSKYLRVRGYTQVAHTVTCDNMWFPITLERSVHVQLSHELEGNVVGHVNVIGYR